jgi:hypothetical protein
MKCRQSVINLAEVGSGWLFNLEDVGINVDKNSLLQHVSSPKNRKKKLKYAVKA